MLRPGERIGDWVVEARLGEGDHGAIFLARHGLNLNLRGALKVARPPDYDQARDNFIAEIEPLLMLRHEALIRVLGWGEDRERKLLWMTTELLRGHSLEDRLGQGAFNLEEVGFVFGRLAGALAMIHSHGAHHGDLRPSDVLLAEGRHIRITGFGTVFRAGNQGQLDAESLAYVGPEYFDDPESCSPVAADIYALGLILHEALTGRRVFPVDSSLKPAPQMARIMGLKMRMGPLDPGEDVPLPLRRIVLQATEPNPAHRPSGLNSFLTALNMATRERFADGEPTSREPDPDLPTDHRDSTPETVRLSSSVLSAKERPTAFPFAPPGWGPRAHRAPDPLAGLVRPITAEVPEAGAFSKVEVVERSADIPPPQPVAPPVASEDLYEEPAAEPEPAAVPEPERAVAPDLAGDSGPAAPISVPEPALGGFDGHDAEEAVLLDPSDEDSSDSGSGLDPQDASALHAPAPEPAAEDAANSRFATGRRRETRNFVPPPPVPDPTLVAPTPPVTGDSRDLPAPAAPSLSPAEPVQPQPLPGQSADHAPAIPEPMLVSGPTILPIEEPPPSESELGTAESSAAVPDYESRQDHYDDDPFSPDLMAQDTEETGPFVLEPRAVTDVSAQGEGSASGTGDGGRGATDDEVDSDWAWHDEGELDDEQRTLDREEEFEDPYTPPFDDLYADALDPSAGDIAADVFGDHGQRGNWVKWVVVISLVLVIGFVIVRAFSDSQQPTDPGQVTPTADIPTPPSEPPPFEPARPEQPPGIDLNAVVAEQDLTPPPTQPDQESPDSAKDALSPEPVVAVREISTSRSSYSRAAPTGSAGSSRSSASSTSSRSGGSSSHYQAPTPAPTPVSAPEASRTGSEPEVPSIESEPEAVATSGSSSTGSSLMDHLRDGWSSLDSGNLVGAQGSFMAVLSMESGNGMAHYGLGQVAERAKDYRGAAYHYGRSLSVLGSNPTMRGEIEAGLRRVGAKTAPAAGASTATTQPASGTQAEEPAAEEEVQVTRKKRDELEESFRDAIWDDDPEN